MEDIKLVEYNDSYAAKVAEMWNKSGENWFGYDSVVNEEEIIAQEKNAGNLKLLLALDGEEVVGYCSFSEYREDEGACYIPLLNVRPDYHGKKVGKTLVKKIVETSISHNGLD